MDDFLTREKFIEWLKSLPQDEPFINDPFKLMCPLEKYASVSGHRLSVSTDTFSLDESAAEYSPEWMRKVVDKVDRLQSPWRLQTPRDILTTLEG